MHSSRPNRHRWSWVLPDEDSWSVSGVPGSYARMSAGGVNAVAEGTAPKVIVLRRRSPSRAENGTWLGENSPFNLNSGEMR